MHAVSVHKPFFTHTHVWHMIVGCKLDCYIIRVLLLRIVTKGKGNLKKKKFDEIKKKEKKNRKKKCYYY